MFYILKHQEKIIDCHDPDQRKYQIVWHCCGKVSSDNIEKLHRRTERLILRHHSSDEALKFLAYETYETMEDRHKKHVYNLVLKCISGKVPKFFKNYFIFNQGVTRRQARHSSLLHLPRVRTARQRSLFITLELEFLIIFITCKF